MGVWHADVILPDTFAYYLNVGDQERQLLEVHTHHEASLALVEHHEIRHGLSPNSMGLHKRNHDECCTFQFCL